MSMDRKDYPRDWPAISLRVREAAGWVCEECGRTCRRNGESVEAFIGHIAAENRRGLAPAMLSALILEAHTRPQRFTLTVHHPDHDKSNRDAVLIALCAPCHLRADHAHHMENARKHREEKRRARGQMTLQAG